jgi:hypothetical protein
VAGIITLHSPKQASIHRGEVIVEREGTLGVTNKDASFYGTQKAKRVFGPDNRINSVSFDLGQMGGKEHVLDV